LQYGAIAFAAQGKILTVRLGNDFLRASAMKVSGLSVKIAATQKEAASLAHHLAARVAHL
jgi:phage protein D